MSAPDFQVGSLIETVKRQASVPDNQSLLEDTDVCDFMSDELQSNVLPRIMREQIEHYVVTEDVTTVVGQTAYDVPFRAVGYKLRDIAIVDQNGNVRNLPQMTIDQMVDNNYGFSFFTQQAGFYMQGLKYMLVPTPTVAYTLRLYYYRRPNRMVPASEGAYVTAVDTGTGALTLDTDVSDYGWTTSTKLDFTNTDVPFNAVLDDVVPTAVGTTTITVSLANAAEISVGDCVCLAGFALVPQVPYELVPLLTQAATVKCLESMGDYAGMQAAQSKLGERYNELFALIAPRVDGEPLRIVGGNNLADWNSPYGWPAAQRWR